jgi:hypothetical protein
MEGSRVRDITERLKTLCWGIPEDQLQRINIPVPGTVVAGALKEILALREAIEELSAISRKKEVSRNEPTTWTGISRLSRGARGNAKGKDGPPLRR